MWRAGDRSWVCIRGTMEFRWKQSESALENASRVLPKMVHKYFKAGRQAMSEDRTWDELHEFRLESKRFRYTLELFRPLYGTPLEERIGHLKKLQQLLGDINDCVATAALLKPHSQYDDMRDQLEKKAGKKTRALCKHWQKKFDAAGEEAAWVAVLQMPKAEMVADAATP